MITDLLWQDLHAGKACVSDSGGSEIYVFACLSDHLVCGEFSKGFQFPHSPKEINYHHHHPEIYYKALSRHQVIIPSPDNSS